LSRRILDSEIKEKEMCSKDFIKILLPSPLVSELMVLEFDPTPPQPSAQIKIQDGRHYQVEIKVPFNLLSQILQPQ